MACDSSGIRRLILASGSPRRRELLSLLGLPFVIKATGVDETQLAGETPPDLVRRVSMAKAEAVPDVRRDELVVAADTIVVLDGKVLGKPTGNMDAKRMLADLRNRLHIVYSGVSLLHPASRRRLTVVGESSVWMRDYTDEEIDAYVDSGDPLDKAGAYAIQHPVFNPVARVDGCSLGVMGLPLCHLAQALSEFGIIVPPHVPGTCRAFSQNDCEVAPAILGVA